MKTCQTTSTLGRGKQGIKKDMMVMMTQKTLSKHDAVKMKKFAIRYAKKFYQEATCYLAAKLPIGVTLLKRTECLK